MVEDRGTEDRARQEETGGEGRREDRDSEDSSDKHSLQTGGTL